MQQEIIPANPLATFLKTPVVRTFNAARLTALVSIVTVLAAGAGGAEMAGERLQASALVTAMAADEGVPRNLVTAMAADEGVPQNLVTAMAADEGSPFMLPLALQADEGVPHNLASA